MLPLYRPIDCAREFVPGAKLPKPKMYSMTLKKMREVKEYINTNLEPLKTLWRLFPKQVQWAQYFKWLNFEMKYIPGGGNLLGAQVYWAFSDSESN